MVVVSGAISAWWWCVGRSSRGKRTFAQLFARLYALLVKFSPPATPVSQEGKQSILSPRCLPAGSMGLGPLAPDL